MRQYLMARHYSRTPHCLTLRHYLTIRHYLTMPFDDDDAGLADAAIAKVG